MAPHPPSQSSTSRRRNFTAPDHASAQSSELGLSMIADSVLGPRKADKIRPSPGRQTLGRGENRRELLRGVSAAHPAFHDRSPRSAPARREITQIYEGTNGQHHLGCDFLPAPYPVAGDRMRRLEPIGHVTRFVTRTLCHVVIPSESGETRAALVRWSAGMLAVRTGPCETTACRLISQRSKYGAKKPRSEEVARWYRIRSSQADLGVSHVDMRSRKRGRRIAFNCVSPSTFPRYLT